MGGGGEGLKSGGCGRGGSESGGWGREAKM